MNRDCGGVKDSVIVDPPCAPSPSRLNALCVQVRGYDKRGLPPRTKSCDTAQNQPGAVSGGCVWREEAECAAYSYMPSRRESP